MKVCFLIPAYNEAATIGEVLERIAALRLETKVIVIDDGSTDETAAIAVAAGATVIRKANGGKGSAIRAGIVEAEGDIAVIQDADMEYDPIEVPELIEPIVRGAADVVFGSRLRGGKAPACLPLLAPGREPVPLAAHLRALQHDALRHGDGL